MKKNITCLCLMLFSGICFAQELTTNKAQTIALLNNEFGKVNGKIIKYAEGNVTVKNSRVSFERGMLTITQSHFENDQMSSTKSYYFSPLEFDGVGDSSKDYKRKSDDEVGDVRIFGNKHKVIWKNQILPEAEKTLMHNSIMSLNFFYNEGNGFAPIKNGLLRLQTLLKAESDPFELNDNEKKLATLISKYNTWKYTNTNGTKRRYENLIFSQSGPVGTYSAKKTVTNANGDVMLSIEKTDFWWNLVDKIKYYRETGHVELKSKELPFYSEVSIGGNGKKTVVADLFQHFYFISQPSDTNGEGKKDIIEIIELIKKIVKNYSGKEPKLEIIEI